MPLVDYTKLFQRADNARNDGRIGEALRYYQDIAEIASERPEDVIYRAQAYQMSAASLNSTITPERQSEYQESLDFLNQAKDIYHSIDNQTAVGACYRDMAIAARKDGDRAVVT